MAWLRGFSLHTLCSFSAPKHSVIRDYRLGCLYYSLFFLIVLYVVIYQVIYKCGYLEMPDVGISMVSSLRFPDVKIDSQKVPYCSQGDSCTGESEEACPCRRFRPEEVLRQNQDTINLVTSVAYIDESGDVARVEYVPDVENYELLLEPTVFQKHHVPGMVNEVVQGYQIQGRLFVGSRGEAPNHIHHQLCKEKSKVKDGAWAHPEGQNTSQAPCYISSDGNVLGNDVFKVSTLLGSMGISLDDMRGVAVYTGGNRTLRRSGFTALLSLEVRNYAYWRGLIDTYYVLDFEMAGRNKHHFSQYATVKRGDRVELAHEYGINVVIAPSGTIASLSRQSFLDVMTNSLGLLTVATMVVKFLASWCCGRLSSVYDKVMKSTTPDGRFMEQMSYRVDQDEAKKKDAGPTATKETLSLRQEFKERFTYDAEDDVELI